MQLGTRSTFCYSSGVVRFLPYMYEMTIYATLLYSLTIKASYQTALESFFASFHVTPPLIISPRLVLPCVTQNQHRGPMVREWVCFFTLCFISSPSLSP